MKGKPVLTSFISPTNWNVRETEGTSINVGQWITEDNRKTRCQLMKPPFCLHSNGERGYELNAIQLHKIDLTYYYYTTTQGVCSPSLIARSSLIVFLFACALNSVECATVE